MCRDDESKEVPLTKEGAELDRLVPNGIRDAELAASQELGETLRAELGLAHPLSTGARITILRAVLDGVVADARRQALATVRDFKHEASAEQEAFQIAAAGELIRLPGQSPEFDQIRDFRYESKRLPTGLSSADSSSPFERAKLRAALWLGATSTRTAERKRSEVLNTLAIAMAKYAHEHRTELSALISTAQAVEVDEAVVSPEDSDPDEEPASSRPRWYVWAGVAVVAAIGLIWGGVALFDDQDPREPAGGSSPGVNTSSGPSSTPTLAGQDIINQIKACDSLAPDSQAAKDLRSRRQVVVDGRCYPDPKLNIGSQAGPTRDSADVAEVSTGQILNNICLKSGQVTSDMVGSKTPIWVRFDLDAHRQAFVSAIWTQGEEGADPC